MSWIQLSDFACFTSIHNAIFYNSFTLIMKNVFFLSTDVSGRLREMTPCLCIISIVVNLLYSNALSVLHPECEERF